MPVLWYMLRPGCADLCFTKLEVPWNCFQEGSEGLA